MQNISRKILCFVVGISILVSCDSTKQNYIREINSKDPTKRVKAIIESAKNKDERAIPLLIDRLEDEDEGVRISAIGALKELTGEDFGYNALAPIYKRKQAVEQWRRWLEKKYAKAHNTSTKKCSTK